MAVQEDKAEPEEQEVHPVQAAPAPAAAPTLEVSLALPAGVSVGALLASGSGSEAASDGSIEWEAVEDEGVSATPSQARPPGAQHATQLMPWCQHARHACPFRAPAARETLLLRRPRLRVARRRPRPRAAPPGASG